MLQPKKLTTHALRQRKSVRISVSLPRELYETLDHMAKAKKVSVAWVIRDAGEKYVSEQWPLLEQKSA